MEGKGSLSQVTALRTFLEVQAVGESKQVEKRGDSSHWTRVENPNTSLDPSNNVLQ